MPPPSDQKLAASSAPPATAPEPKQIHSAGRWTSRCHCITPSLSARALFYGGEPGRADMRSMAKEQEQAMKPLAESAPQANRFERKQEGLSQLGKAAGTVTQLRPLGLRYSFVVRGADGQEQEVDVATASKSIQPVFLTVEANQDAYLQVWETVGSSTPQLLWPEKESGQTSLKDYRWSAATHSSADGEQAYHPDGSSLPSPVRINHEARNRHGRTSSLSTNSKNPSPQATEPARKNAPPTSSTQILPQPLRSPSILPSTGSRNCTAFTTRMSPCSSLRSQEP